MSDPPKPTPSNFLQTLRLFSPDIRRYLITDAGFTTPWGPSSSGTTSAPLAVNMSDPPEHMEGSFLFQISLQ